MGKSVTEAHAQLYHYTTAAGLQGIVESQQLRATNIAYLNDAEEHTGFFDRRLPHLLSEPIRVAVDEKANTASGRKEIEAHGGVEKFVEKLMKDMVSTFRDTSLKLNEPYVTAFCSTSLKHTSTSSNGLLSQWRGYGTDGGYAIVLETNGLESLLEEENTSFHYQFSILDNVEYYDQNTHDKAAYEETLEFEAIVQQAIRNFILTNNPEELDVLAEPVTWLSCMHKHSGFAEEAEVRIVVSPSNIELFKLTQKSDKRPRKPVEFLTKNGVLVPYIMLFGHQSNGHKTKLPISKIIVGPHPDRFKRQKAIELMLEQYEIDAKVTVSDIPYLGR